MEGLTIPTAFTIMINRSHCSGAKLCSTVQWALDGGVPKYLHMKNSCS